GLSFEFKSDLSEPEGQRVLTGHDSGVITLNIAEANDVQREIMRMQMDEVYRTLLGHFRHEIAHYYWEILIAPNPDRLSRCRDVFGDERTDYGKALEQHYQKPNDDQWRAQHISRYAASHPWEDWAESWAHYLHMVDTLETAYSFGISIKPKSIDDDTMNAEVSLNPYKTKDFEWIFDRWIPVTTLMNCMNRSMGLRELYPFEINHNVYKKIAFVHEIIVEHRTEAFERLAKARVE
ncbi:putative zinc-binding metallopeptidase, partial [Brucella sp. 21LCYQ03]|nr:putative zinc-binding metallopeptidase [Brucella sp. 21LCYQ03]